MHTPSRLTIHRFAGLYAGITLGPLAWRSWLIIFTFFAVIKALNAIETLLGLSRTGEASVPDNAPAWPLRIERWVDTALIVSATGALILAGAQFDTYVNLAAMNFQPLVDTPLTFTYVPLLLPVFYAYPRQIARSHGLA